MNCAAITNSGKRCQNQAGEDGYCYIESHQPDALQEYGLTVKQKRFADAVMRTQNQTAAARMAGYDGNEASLRRIGYENMRKPKIRQYISDFIGEYALGAIEILLFYSRIIEVDILDFYTKNGTAWAPDLNKIKKLGLGNLVAEIEPGEIHKKPDGSTKQKPPTIKLFNKLEALKKLGEYHRLFVERLEIDDRKTWIVPIDPEDIDTMDPHEWAAKYGPGNSNKNGEPR